MEGAGERYSCVLRRGIQTNIPLPVDADAPQAGGISVLKNVWKAVVCAVIPDRRGFPA